MSGNLKGMDILFAFTSHIGIFQEFQYVCEFQGKYSKYGVLKMVQILITDTALVRDID